MPLPPLWRLGACAALLGLGQNGLLVMLPVLVARFGLPLSQWAGLILLGSMLFLVGSPFWGGVADRRGARPVVVQALLGYLLSFALIAAALWASVAGLLAPMAMLVVLAVARVLYGLTVSGMVPACQQWALALHPGGERLPALAAVSAGLSSGRLLGPLLAAASLSLSVYAPFALMLVAGLLALLLLPGVPLPARDSDTIDTAHSAAHDSAAQSLQGIAHRLPPRSNLAYLAMALLLAMSVSLMQLGLPASLQQALAIDATRAGHWMGVLLSLGAVGALATQIGVVRARRLESRALLALGAAGLALGYALLAATATFTLTPGLHIGLGLLFALGVVLASTGAALAVPGYTEAATRHQAQGTSAGLLSMAHTLGYGLAALCVSLIDPGRLLPLALMAAVALLLLIPLSRRGRSGERTAMARHGGHP
ncbi:MFS transporter [Salinicola sp. JS01]|uniref:MFS transporter n=1 Tax=Salinicola sp. JS01 TaxID=3050071 RepID=UPI00255BD8B0|nr:MFS transporter [Salinicola sp. JS01]WIX33899.1 MFS transporter [Salinicola sp. JS01]